MVFAFFFGRPGAKLQWGMEVDQHSCDGRLRQNGILQTWTGYEDLGNDFFFHLGLFYVILASLCLLLKMLRVACMDFGAP